jgi:hypothetical protein
MESMTDELCVEQTLIELIEQREILGKYEQELVGTNGKYGKNPPVIIHHRLDPLKIQ